MNVAELGKLIGKSGIYVTKSEGFILHVTIKNVRNAYGNVQVFIARDEDSTGVWVSVDRVSAV